MTPPAAPRRITLAIYPEVQSLDLVGPLEVFATANRFVPGGAPAYELEVVAVDAGVVRASSGLRLAADRPLGSPSSARNRSIDTLVVAGGQGTEDAIRDGRLVRWLAAVAPGCRRVTSVCSGAFLRAAAGLLDGRRATTHWSECDTLARFFPAVSVEPDPIFVRDGNVATSAGITAGMDLALALVEEDHGREVALEVARWLVMFVQRPGGQSQFSSQLQTQLAERSPLRELQAWIVDHPADDLSVPVLAARVSMSTRHFARVFREEVGATPAAYVEQVRVEAARRLLESTTRAVDDVARACGFGTTETMQRAFHRTVGVTPGEYRRHFQPDRRRTAAAS
jgi:transcriptional regulator GlxA family with amidase domain